MKPAGYIGSGVGCGVLGVLVLIGAHSGDGTKRAIYEATVAYGGNPAPPDYFGWGDVIGALLLLAAAGLLLVGIIGAGVRAGRHGG